MIRRIRKWWNGLTDEQWERAARIGLWLDIAIIVIAIVTVILVNYSLERMGY